MKALVLVSSVLAACACTTAQPPAVPIAQPVAVPISRFDTETLNYIRFHYGIERELRLAARSEREWRSVWGILTSLRVDPPPPPPVDFSRDMVLVAAMGPQGSGGYLASIDRVEDEGAALHVHVRYSRPGPSCGAIAVVSYPVDMVRVAASAKQLRWTVTREVKHCV